MKTKKNLQEKKKVTIKNQNKMMMMTMMKSRNLKTMILMKMETNNILEVKKKLKKLI